MQALFFLLYAATSIRVSQHTYEIASVAEAPVIETCSLGPCIALALYDGERRLGALGHFDAGTDVGTSVETMARAFAGKGAPRVVLAGGLVGWSEDLLERLQTSLRDSRLSVSEVKGPYPREGKFKCARLDLRDGTLAVWDDPGVKWMRSARYDLNQPLTRTRDTVFYDREEGTKESAPPMPPPMPLPIPPAR